MSIFAQLNAFRLHSAVKNPDNNEIQKNPAQT